MTAGRLAITVAWLVAGLLGAGCAVPAPPCDIVIAASDVPDVERVAPDARILATAADVDPAGWRASDAGIGGGAVELRLRPEAADRLAEHTAANVGGFLVIAVDDVVVSTPMIQSAIEGGAMTITGAADEDIVEAFRSCLPNEILPAP